VFDVCWRLAILTLPWQTRWFHDASLAGWPWEQGRWSVYASWVFLIATVVSGWPYLRSQLRSSRVRRASCFFAALFACTVIPTVFHSDVLARFVAVSQWWIEALLLLAFGLTLAGAKVGWRSVATWIVISLIPEALLGVAQYAMQTVVGFKWLGIAPHLTQTPGTAVVEFGLWRYLRVYAGFPHPNIFGGWLVVGILAAFLLAATAETKKSALFAIMTSALFSVALVLTFSRGAWLALAAGVVVMMIFGRSAVSASERGNISYTDAVSRKLTKQFFYLAVAASALGILIVGASQRAVVFARTDTSSRLEAKSITQREMSLSDGLAIFRRHPLFGSGPNAELLDAPNASVKASAPLEPPHNVLLLMLDDLGVIGVVLLACFAWPFVRRIPRFAWPFAAAVVVIGLVDHYPWSTWSGLCLVLIVGLFCLSDESKPTA
jgi:hypothetical protein